MDRFEQPRLLSIHKDNALHEIPVVHKVRVGFAENPQFCYAKTYPRTSVVACDRGFLGFLTPASPSFVSWDSYGEAAAPPKLPCGLPGESIELVHTFPTYA